MTENDYIKNMQRISEKVLQTSYMNFVENHWNLDGETLDEICRELVGISNTEYNRERAANIIKELIIKQ